MNSSIPHKTCRNHTGCVHPDGPDLPATTEYWHKAARGQYGLSSMCKLCYKAYARKRYNEKRDEILTQNRQWREDNPNYSNERYAKNRDALRAYHRKWVEENREHVRKQARDNKRKRYALNPEPFKEKSRKWHKANPEYKRNYKAKNRDKILEQSRNRYAVDPEKHREASRQWRRDNPDKVLRQQREYYKKNQQRILIKRREYHAENKDKAREYRKANSDRYLAHTRNRRAKIKQVEGHHTASELQDQFNRQKGRCYWCGNELDKDNYHADHVIPITKGGDNYITNIVCACPVCNLTKSNKLPHEWEGGGGKLL